MKPSEARRYLRRGLLRCVERHRAAGDRKYGDGSSRRFGERLDKIRREVGSRFTIARPARSVGNDDRLRGSGLEDEAALWAIEKTGWGTWIRTKTGGVRVRGLFP